MVKLRLTRKGRKKRPVYRLVAIEDSRQRDGEVIEFLGFYDPNSTPFTFTLKEDRVKHWLSVGAQPSQTVHRLLSTVGVMAYVPTQSSSQKIAKKDRKKTEE